MEDIRRNAIQWWIFQNSQPIKNIKWSCTLMLLLSLLPNFVQNLIMLGLKKF